MSSRNKPIIDSLTQTVQQKDPKLYSLLQKIEADLDEAYTALFTGPLPAVSGFELTSIDADVIEGIVARANLPEEIAYEDEENTFTEDILLHKVLDPYLRFKFDTGNQFFHLGAAANADYIIGQNAKKVVGAWAVDDAAVNGCAIEFLGGDIYFLHYTPALGTPRFQFKWTGKDLSFRNAAFTAFRSIINVDANNIIQLGKDFQTSGEGHIAIPDTTSANLPASGVAALNGLIVIDTTNHRLCFYEGGLRYYVNGTAF